MSSCRVFVPFGAVGMGISQEAFDNGIKMKPDIISSDAGSTDSGPYYLGTGKGKYSRGSVKKDLRMMLLGSAKLSVPVTIGSCGTCGSNLGVDEFAEICLEICREENLDFKIAKIYTQQEPSFIKSKYLDGKITALEAAPEIDEKTFDECSNIVALSGIEPFVEAFKSGADIILCGRSSDTAVMAAMPIMKGCAPGPVWHGSKIAECGSMCTSNPLGGGLFITFDDDSFTVEPTADESLCTVESVSAHMLYENSDPYKMTEPSGMIDTYESVYKQIDERKVKVTGSKFIKAEKYTMKLEGSGPVGYQTISFVGIQDKRIMKDPMKWINNLASFIQDKLDSINIEGNYSYALKPYGWNAVSGTEMEPGNFVPREIGLMLVVTADTQECATQVAKTFNPMLLHYPVKENEQLPTFAFPFSPAEIEKGLIYEFKLNHVVELENPLDIVSFEYIDTKNRRDK